MYQDIRIKNEMPRTSLFTTDKNELLNDPEINVIVEVINETEAAFEIVSTALKNGKDVVSASKKMIAEHLPQLACSCRKKQDISFLYEVCCLRIHTGDPKPGRIL